MLALSNRVTSFTYLYSNALVSSGNEPMRAEQTFLDVPEYVVMRRC